MSPDVVLYADQSLPSTAITWLDADGEPVPLATGWTLAVRLVDDAGYVRATASSVVGYDVAPNAVINWGQGDLSGAGGLLRLLLTATDSGGNVRYFRPDSPPVVLVRPAPTSAE